MDTGRKIAAAALVAWAAWCGAGLAGEARWRVARAATPPVIDGTVDDAEWAGAARLSSFSDAGNRVTAASPTEVFLQYDDENLYVAFRARIDFEPDPAPVPHDSLEITTVDAVRLAVAPPGAKTWMKFTLERGGGANDMRVAGQVRLPAPDWEPAWRRAVRIVPDDFFSTNLWEGEIALPWTTLEMDPPAPGSPLSFQFTRYAGNVRRATELNDRVTVWADVPSVWNIIDPNNNGALLFAGDAPVLRFDGYADAAAGEGGFAGKLTRRAKDAKLTARIWHRSDFQRKYGEAKAEPLAGEAVAWNVPLAVAEKTPVMMTWKLEDDLGVIAGGRYFGDAGPRFLVEAAPIYSRDEVAVVGDLSRLDLAGGEQVALTLRKPDGAVAATKTIPLKKGARYFEERLSLRQVPVGADATLKATLRRGAREVYAFETKIKNPPRPDWMNQHPGRVAEPPPGWSAPALARDGGAVEFRMGANSYRFAGGPLPDAIRLRGEAFSDGAMAFVVKTARGVQTLRPDGPVEVTAEDARGATLRWRGASDEVELAATVRLEFDGLAWYEVELSPRAEGVVVSEVSLRLPVEPQRMRYMRGLNISGTMTTSTLVALVGRARTTRELPRPNMAHAYDISGDGWRFGSSFAHFYWLGGEDRGLYFVLPSKHNMAVRERFSDVVDTDDAFSFTLFLVDHETPLTAPRAYTFGTILTPTREIRNPAALRKIGAAYIGLAEDGGRRLEQTPEMYAPWGRRFFRDPDMRPIEKDYFTTAMLLSWKIKTAMVGNPTPPPEELARIDTEIAAIRNTIGGSPMLWYDALFTMFHLPQAIDYVYEWELYPQCRLPIEQYGTFVCPTEAWADYYLHGARERMKQGIKSFYMDMTGYHVCTNRFHGCGIRDPETGEVTPRLAFLEGRELFLRYQKLVKDNDPDGLLVMHLSPLSPMALWMDAITHGEAWTTAPDYATLAPEFYQLTLMAGEQLGVPTLFFPGLILTHYRQAAQSKVTLAEACGLSFSHGESMWNGVAPQLAGLRMVWDALEAFGVDAPDAVWTPYWRHPLSKAPEGVGVSGWTRGGEELLVVFNWSYEPQPLDLAALAGRTVTDALAGAPWTDANATIAPRDFKLLRVGR